MTFQSHQIVIRSHYGLHPNQYLVTKLRFVQKKKHARSDMENDKNTETN